MSTEKVGTVTGVFEKKWQSATLYSFKIEGSDIFFRLGRTQPDFKVGDKISFTEKNNNVEPTSVIVQVSGATTSTAPSGQGSSGPAQSADVGERIKYQAARRDAVSLVVAALHTDHLPHASNVAKGKRLDLLMGYVKEITKELLEEEDKK